MKKSALILMAVILLLPLIAYGDDKTNDSFIDPYEAYGLTRKDSDDTGLVLESAMEENPPSAIILQPVFYYRTDYGTIPLAIGQLTLERGKSVKFSLDLQLTHTSGKTVPLRSEITLKYDGEKYDTLFHADTNTYGNPTIYKDGLYINELGNHKVTDKAVFTRPIDAANSYDYFFNGPAEEFLSITLQVDKGDAQNADGNIGFVFCRIVKVKLGGGILGGFSNITKQLDKSEFESEKAWISIDPKVHVGPIATVVISVMASVAALVGGVLGIGSNTAAGLVDATTENENNNTEEAKDPAYKTDTLPEFPNFNVGSDGERISKRPNGIIEASFPNGDIVTYFPNGTVQRKSPDGSTYEEWSDGTVSTKEDGQFIVKKPDGTMTVVEENGEEIIYNPDGTSIESKNDGRKVTKDADNNVISVESDSFIVTRHPQDEDALIINSKYGGSLIMREKTNTEFFTENDKLNRRTVSESTLEGEIKTEEGTFIFKPDGSQEIKMNDGTIAKKHADGSINVSSPDGTDLKYNSSSGEIDYKFPDGSYIKGNSETGEVDSKMSDGSYSKRDAKGNGSFYNANNGTKGVCHEDGSFKTENEHGSFTHSADGTMELKENNGMSLVQRPDGSQCLTKPDGTKVEVDKAKFDS